jgi:pimeloyl-ACP methyl ester carboxylesterase
MSPLSGRSFARIMPLLARGRRVVAVDHPGYGESDPVPGRAPLIEDYAASAWGLADALGLPAPVDLLGHHTGSKVAVEMAHQRPDGVRRLVLVSLSYPPKAAQAEASAAFAPVPLDEDGTRFRRLWDLTWRHRGPGQTLPMAAAAYAEALRGGEGYEDGHHAAIAYNDALAERAGALDHAVTVLNPADDAHAVTPRGAALFRQVELRDHPEWGHGLFDAHAEDVARAVEEALRA